MSGGKFEFDDGGFYVGEWQDGEANGYGVCTGPSNIGKFEGFWENGVEVSGIYTWPNCTQYKGQWKDGQRQGFGQEIFSKCEYSGEWVHGLKHGSGVIKTGAKKRACFEGTWKSGLQDGHGIEIYNKGGFYSGQWKEGCRHGYGIRGWATLDKLLDGAVSIRQLLLQQNSPRDSCSVTISSSSADLEEKLPANLKSSTSRPLNSQSTIDLVTEKVNNDLKITPAQPRQRVSVFQMVMNNFKRGDDTEQNNQPKNEFYKGTWERDMRHGPGICFYEDGSKFIGQWKENKRHGYGLFINAEGEKSGGKWYSDSLILMTRRKNFKLPMVKKKIKRSILNAIDAAEKANKKTKLAITRGLAARKLAEEAETAGAIAVGDATKAQDYRRKFTLHPLLEANLKNPPTNTDHMNKGNQNSKSTPNLTRRSSGRNNIFRKRSSTSVLQNVEHESLGKKTSLLAPISKSSGNFDMDLLYSFQKNPVFESALYAAMDTTIGAGALNPYLSQMVLMQYNDAQTRLTNLLTQQVNASDKAPTSALSTALVAAMAINPSSDVTDSVCQSSEESRKISDASNSSVSSRRSSTTSENSDDVGHKQSGSFWRKLSSGDILGSPKRQKKQTRTLLHPSDCARKRKSGVANISLDTDPSLRAEDARVIQMKGKLLTGDEVNYSYIALTTAVEGKETIVLYTDHPKPTFRQDVSISEKTLVNSSTGLYRTLVGNVPSVLNVSMPTGIPALDRHDSVDSGTANDDADLYIDSKGYIKTRKAAAKDSKSRSTCIANKDGLKVTYSYSPSFEERDTSNDNDAEKYSEHRNYNMERSSSCKQNSSSASSKISTRKERNFVSVCQRTPSLSQVVINQKREPSKRIDEITIERRDGLEIGLSGNSGKSKHRFVNLLAKTWKGRSSQSIRSTSTDSGYKQSMSIDDSTLSVHLSPRAEQHSREQDNVTETENIKSNAVIGRTVVTIENETSKKASKRNSLKRSSLKKKLSSNLSRDDSFDQNKTIEMSPLPERKINLPTFCDDYVDSNNDRFTDPNDSECIQSEKNKPSVVEDYVILGDEERNTHSKEFDRTPSLTWV